MVTFKCEDHLEVSTKVVPRQRVAKRNGCLILTTSHTSNQFHARIIIKINARFVGSELIVELRGVFILMIVTLLVEDVTILHCLDFMV